MGFFFLACSLDSHHCSCNLTAVGQQQGGLEAVKMGQVEGCPKLGYLSDSCSTRPNPSATAAAATSSEAEGSKRRRQWQLAAVWYIHFSFRCQGVKSRVKVWEGA